MTIDDVTVLYHGGGCRDGFCAAWMLRKLYPAAEFLPVNYGTPLPDVRGRRVIVADFCPATVGELVDLVVANGSATVLDHHATAEPILREVRYLTADSGQFAFSFDTTKSGARLAWEYAAYRLPTEFMADPPWVVRYVEDRDLWRWALPDSREINAAIRLTDLTFAAWDALAEMDPETLVGRGEAVLMRDAEIVAAHVRHAVPTAVGGHTVPAVNATTLVSEIGHELCRHRPFSATYFDDLKAGVRRWSLRSDANGMDVAAVAKSLGGGGHRHAAGFETRLDAAGI